MVTLPVSPIKFTWFSAVDECPLKRLRHVNLMTVKSKCTVVASRSSVKWVSEYGLQVSQENG